MVEEAGGPRVRPDSGADTDEGALLETPEADAAEQLAAAGDSDDDGWPSPESLDADAAVPEADAAEQARVVEDGDDEYR
ncbi:hypothetical protein [Nocardiopsis ansamitocini]|uniref:Uncharacterized protein n=1 Tax=Nocardiopsis ansamitocini TaxID=1670832 RepID=A0A9W6P414_9ACTN|nr:hypothetical protein [Nocardiopsis ansamitocini]GLU46766.1 hypothetical protein Nans01_11170 [Nocardiopsis ansamitocini]